MPECGMKEISVYIKLQVWRGGRMYIMSYIYIYIYIYNLHSREWASVFNALFKTRPVSTFAFLRGLNMQLLQSRNWFIVCRSVYIYIYIYIYMYVCMYIYIYIYIYMYRYIYLIFQGLKNSC